MLIERLTLWSMKNIARKKSEKIFVDRIKKECIISLVALERGELKKKENS